MAAFARKLIDWQRRHGRQGLPWQGTRDPYRIWLAEVMLQQTQVAAVIPYYERFLERFADVGSLAAASEDAVLRLWSGLGYYARGRNLHAAAKNIAVHGFPTQTEGIQALPGIGPSTAAAIAVFAFGRRAAILDGNVKRVLARCFGVEGDEQWGLAHRLLPRRDIETYTQALMDLGATLCTRTRPACGRCPVAKDCVALREDRVAALPRSRARKARPLRRTTWLVLEHQGSVLLERRPGSGIWGGLWVFPEGPARELKIYCRKNFSVDVAGTEKMPVIEHGFTHFRLDILPIYCRIRKRYDGKNEASRLWIDVADAAQAAVPAPVKALVSSLLLARGRDQAI